MLFIEEIAIVVTITWYPYILTLYYETGVLVFRHGVTYTSH
jgi:hypothetical protein